MHYWNSCGDERLLPIPLPTSVGMLPVDLQIVARAGADGALLQAVPVSTELGLIVGCYRSQLHGKIID